MKNVRPSGSRLSPLLAWAVFLAMFVGFLIGVNSQHAVDAANVGATTTAVAAIPTVTATPTMTATAVPPTVTPTHTPTATATLAPPTATPTPFAIANRSQEDMTIHTEFHDGTGKVIWEFWQVVIPGESITLEKGAPPSEPQKLTTPRPTP